MGKASPDMTRAKKMTTNETIRDLEKHSVKWGVCTAVFPKMSRILYFKLNPLSFYLCVFYLGYFKATYFLTYFERKGFLCTINSKCQP